MNHGHKLADHVRTRTTDARIERQWAAIEQADLPGPFPLRVRRIPWIAAGLALGAMVAAALVLRPPPSDGTAPALRGGASLDGNAPALRGGASLPAGALVESAQAEIAVQLDDGSRVELSPESQLRLLENQPGAVALELRAGTARFQVKHDRARRFEVHAGVLDVRVIGTRFELTRKREPGFVLLRVAVSEGVVEVRRRDATTGDVQRIREGETWSARVADAASAPAAPSASGAPTARATEPAEPADALEAEARAAREPGESPLAGEPDESAADRNESERADAAVQHGASALFRRASLARRAGRMQEAAEGYAELLARHPRDARAGLSAFELGRIRMDALDDAAGAIQALERAVAAGSGASFHEDALARIVVASDALGRGAACRKARERYLARYPDGVHAHALAARCR
jgi:tetratricopeptide (TPR) repeat protein